MNKKSFLSILFLSLLIVGCNGNPSNTSSIDSNTSNNSISTSDPLSVDLTKVFNELTSDELALEATLLYQEFKNIDDITAEYEMETIITSYISSNEYYISEVDETSVYFEEHYFKSDEGYLLYKELLKDNTVEEVVDESSKFDELVVNPFKTLDVSDLEVKDNRIIVNFNTDFEVLSYLITGYEFEIENIYLDVDSDGDLTNIVIETTYDDSYLTSYGVYVKNTYNAKIMSRGEIVIPTLEPKEMTPELEKLQQAFEQLKNNNYTIDYHDVDFDGENDVIINALVTEKAVLITYNEEERGYLEDENGVAPFKVDKTNGVKLLGQKVPQKGETLKNDYLATFDYSAAVFEYLGENRYFLPAKTSFYRDASNLLPDVVIGDNAELVVAGALFITLGENTITFDYMWEIPNFNYGGTTKVIVSDIGSTVFPYDVDTTYVEKEPSTWRELDETLADKLHTLIEDENNLPFFKPSDDIETNYNEEGKNLTITYKSIEKETLATTLQQYIQLLKDKGYVYKETIDGTEVYYLGEEIEVRVGIDEQNLSFTIDVYSHRTLVRPTKTTWKALDEKYGTSNESKLTIAIGDPNLLPCYDFNKEYHYFENENLYMFMVQSYDKNIDESGYLNDFHNDLLALGYELKVENDKNVYYYQDIFTVKVDCSYGYCTITLNIL